MQNFQLIHGSSVDARFETEIEAEDLKLAILKASRIVEQGFIGESWGTLYASGGDLINLWLDRSNTVQFFRSR